MGLMISQKLVHQYKGTLDVYSPGKDQGTSVSFSMQMKPCNEETDVIFAPIRSNSNKPSNIKLDSRKSSEAKIPAFVKNIAKQSRRKKR